MSNFYLVFALIFPFLIIAGLMVYLISFKEYQHHFFEKKKAVKMSLEPSFLTIAFFWMMTILIWYLFSKFLI